MRLVGEWRGYRGLGREGGWMGGMSWSVSSLEPRDLGGECEKEEMWSTFACVHRGRKLSEGFKAGTAYSALDLAVVAPRCPIFRSRPQMGSCHRRSLHFITCHLAPPPLPAPLGRA